MNIINLKEIYLKIINYSTNYHNLNIFDKNKKPISYCLKHKNTIILNEIKSPLKLDNVYNMCSFYTNSFGHSINELYKLIYFYLFNKYDCPIIIIKIKKTHFFYQFLNIFIPEEKIIMIEVNKIYSINEIKMIKITDKLQPGNLLNNQETKQIIQFINNILFKKIKTININTYDIIINCNRTLSIIEPERSFNNYNEFKEKIHKNFSNVLFFDPSKYTILEQIYLMNNCKLFIYEWGSALSNNYWLKPFTKTISIIHPWMAYFGENQKKSIFVQIFKNILKIHYTSSYCKTYIDGILHKGNYIKREKAKKNSSVWGDRNNLKNSYKYNIDIENVIKLIKNYKNNNYQ